MSRNPIDRRHVVSALAVTAGAGIFPRLLPAISLVSHSASGVPDKSGPPAPRKERFLDIAESLAPKLCQRKALPVCSVTPVPAPGEFLRWRMVPSASLAESSMHALVTGETLYLDFGQHLVGHFEFQVAGDNPHTDSPVRLEVRFGEVPGDVAEPLSPYNGSLSESWLPVDQVDVENLPALCRIERRHAFRWVSIKILSRSNGFRVRLGNFQATAVSSAGDDTGKPASTASALQRRIDEVSLATLRDCMQSVFEDGPRRDQRLWLGDLRVQALVNYHSFRNYSLVKRCLYLLAAFPQDDGLLRACVFDRPIPHRSSNTILDYAALFVPTLREYVGHSGDRETGRDLYPVVRRQLELLGRYLNADGLFVAPSNAWIFIDWRKELDRNAAMQGILIFAWQQARELALQLGYPQDVQGYEAQIERMSAAAIAAYYDRASGVFLSGTARQLSWASQAWMAIAGVGDQDLRARALQTALDSPNAIQPSTPYLYHYVTEALILNGLRDRALAQIESYWGGMIKAGADTFWELFDPTNSLASPYHDVHINSFCHAWSCGPSYLLRKYFWS